MNIKKYGNTLTKIPQNGQKMNIIKTKIPYKNSELLGSAVGRDDPGAPYVKLSEYGNIVQKHINSTRKLRNNPHGGSTHENHT